MIHGPYNKPASALSYRAPTELDVPSLEGGVHTQSAVAVGNAVKGYIPPELSQTDMQRYQQFMRGD